MNLLSLGSAQRRLFAIHEAAVATTGAPRAAVLCYPWGAEYTYAHRSVRQLALKLALSGCHTLRFDYFGTGDSGGDEFEADLAGCESDVEAAMEALTDIAGTSQVTLIGLRAGANIAAGVAARHASIVEALVLWDPIVAELRSLPGALPQRTAMFVTDSTESRDRLVGLGFAGGTRPATIEFVPTQSPWVESATMTGVLPVSVIQRVIEWLR
ncbi:MAG TPA: alpha/beta hydrolase [Steroidobacteraceae bacterium]|nr:alpha/beta hydrolase [Steroidobacteraceae bacterium]